MKGMVKQASGFLFASPRSSTYGSKYASPLRLLRTRLETVLIVPFQ